MDPIDSIQWHGPAETWMWPPTEEQRARLATVPAPVDGMVEIVAIGPEGPGLILVLGVYKEDIDVLQESGETLEVRFGFMPLDAYKSLPEHDGW